MKNVTLMPLMTQGSCRTYNQERTVITLVPLESATSCSSARNIKKHIIFNKKDSTVLLNLKMKVSTKVNLLQWRQVATHSKTHHNNSQIGKTILRRNLSGIREKGAKKITEIIIIIIIIILSRRYRLGKAAKLLIITTKRILAIGKIQCSLGLKVIMMIFLKCTMLLILRH